MKKSFFDKTPVKYLINIIAIVALFAIIMCLVNFKVLNRYQANQLIPVGFNIILAVSLNLTAGFLGQLPLGHAGFMSIGAYTSAFFTLSTGVDNIFGFILSLLVGGCVAAIFGVLIGLPVLRLSGDYLAIITLGFGEIIRVIITNLNFLGGAHGLGGIPKLTTIPITFFCVVISVFLMYTFIKSRHGRAVIAIREDSIAAEASGIPTTYYKTFTFAFSAFFAGIAGGLYAHYIGVLNPSNFGFMKSVEYLIMVVLGGLGSMLGSVVAASGLTLIPELLRGLDDYRLVIYSLLLVVVMIFKPSGLFGRYDFSLNGLLAKIFRRKKADDSKKSEVKE